MNQRQAAYLNIAISILCAAAMIGISQMTTSSNRFVYVGLIIAMWWVPFSILSGWGEGGSVQRELRCLRRRIGRVFSK